MAQLLRVDKNGTKYWMSTECPKCGGKGHIWYYDYIQGGVCFDCGGTGYKEHKWKEYTPEYAQKLADRRLAKTRAKSDEINAEFLKKMGMSEDGKVWCVIGNTFEIKDELKEKGARYSNRFGWHFDHADNGYVCAEVSIEEIAEKDANTWVWDLYEEWFIIDLIKQKKDALAPKTDSEYVGNIGDKVEMRLTFKDEYTFTTHFTYSGELNFIRKFVDENGNTFVWKSSKYLELEQDKEYTVKGTIKDHSEYKGDKQTILTRCKIA